MQSAAIYGASAFAKRFIYQEDVRMENQQERLFVVVDPRDHAHPALERTLITSRLRQQPPEINVFLTCDDKAFSEGKPANLVRNQHWLDTTIREPLNRLLLKYEVTLSWETPWPKTLILASERYASTMILLPISKSITFQRLKQNTGKWEPLKHSHSPVLLVRHEASERRKTILAAVNFQASSHDQRALNDRILGHARRVANQYAADLHLANAYLDNLHYPDRGLLARESGLSAGRIHVHHGYTDEAVSMVAAKIGADMVVMGTLNQRGKEGSIRRGNTATRVITALTADTLVVN